MSGKFACSRGISLPRAGCSAKGSSFPISENETLFQLIGTTYGGDGESTFALPDLRGRIPLHQGNGFILAETGGAEEITLTVQQIAAHYTSVALQQRHRQLDGAAEQRACRAFGRQHAAVRRGQSQIPLTPTELSPVGGSQPHTNFQPYLCIDFIISLFGIFPSPR